MKSIVAGHRKLTTTNWEQSSKLILLQLPKKLLKNLCQSFYSIWHLKQIGKGEKSPLSGCLISWPKLKKKIILNCHLFFYTTVNHFSIWCATKSGFYTVSSVAGVRRSSKILPESNLHQKAVMVSVWLSAAGLTYYSFLYPGKNITSEKYAQQFDELHQKLQCLQLTLVNRRGPILLHENAQLHISQPTLQQLNKFCC